MKPVQPCGTPAAYQRHYRAEGTPVTCTPCLEAAAADFKTRRQRNAARQRAQQAARARAHTRLAAAHQTEFRALYLRELARNTTALREEN